MIVLDTHTWVWLNDDTTRLSAEAGNAIQQERTLGVSPISMWEIAMLWQYERLELALPLEAWLEKACAQPKIRLLPITTAIAARLAQLEMHGDPADRIIVATALVHQCKLVTRDDNITVGKLVETIWYPPPDETDLTNGTA